MMPEYLSVIWADIAPALGNHIWQSTLFACAAGLLTLILRNNHARARYWLWFAASVKFLIPFSLLVDIGSHLAWSRGSAGTTTGLYFAMEQVGQPFVQQTMPLIARTVPAAGSQNLNHFLPALLAMWLCGFLVVLFIWSVRWRQISKAVREAMVLREGREVEALRRLERVVGVRRRIEMLLSRVSLEPGIFGIARPVLVWPRGISDCLDDAHLEAILAHELWHVRRRDNLAATLHMAVEAIFWFHPLVWWMGTRLVDERERACDEHVVELGSDRHVYAESILKICEFCVGSPLTCVSGVTGADLKQRIVRIMSERVTHKLDFGKKLLLSIAALLAVAAPIVAGILHVTPSRAESQVESITVAVPAYATVSITPNKSATDKVMLMFGVGEFASRNASLQQVIRVAYGVEDDRIVGSSAWLESEKYDVVAKQESSGANDPRKLSLDQSAQEQKIMLQALLADRLKLALHRETREISVYALVLAKDVPKLQDSDPGGPHSEWHKGPDGIARPGIWMDGNAVVGQGIGTAPLLFHLSRILHRTILDETGLSGTYNFTLKLPDGVKPGIDEPSLPKSSEPAILAAMERQLGLKLEIRKASMEVLVIDHVEKPVELQTQNISAPVPAYETVSMRLDKAGTTSLTTGKGVIHQRMMFSPGELTGRNVSLQDLVRDAYGVEDYRISGAPNWLTSELYDIDAKAEKSVVDEMQKLGRDQGASLNQRMLQAMLADRLKLAHHSETRELPIYELVIAKSGPKLHKAVPGDTYTDGIKGPDGLPFGPGRVSIDPGRLTVQAFSMNSVAQLLSRQLGRTVVDRTGLSGEYDFTIRWTPDVIQAPTPTKAEQMGNSDGSAPPLSPTPPPPPPPPQAPGASIFTEIQEQLGLELESKEVPSQVLVIDHVEKPSQN